MTKKHKELLAMEIKQENTDSMDLQEFNYDDLKCSPVQEDDSSCNNLSLPSISTNSVWWSGQDEKINLSNQVDPHHVHMDKCTDKGCNTSQLFVFSKAITPNSKSSYTSLDQCLDHSLTPELFPIADLIWDQPKQKKQKTSDHKPIAFYI